MVSVSPATLRAHFFRGASINLHGTITQGKICPDSNNGIVLFPETHLSYAEIENNPKVRDLSTVIARSEYHGFSALARLGYNLICTEGANGPLHDFQIPKSDQIIIDGLEREDKLEYLFSLGRLSAVAIHKIMNPERMHVYGVDNMELNNKSFELLRKAIADAMPTEEIMGKLQVLADQRSLAMVQNTLRLMNATQTRNAIMVFGVAHLDVIVAELEIAQSSFVVLEPNGLRERLQLTGG